MKRTLQSTVPFTQLQPIYQKMRLHSTASYQLLGVPFQITFQEAAQKFSEYDSRRMFKPFSWQQYNAIVPSLISPLKAMYIPVTMASISVTATQYHGDFGVVRYRTITFHDAKGHLKTKKERYIEWYPTSGELKPVLYNKDHQQMQFYAGKKFPASLMQSSIANFFPSQVQPFNQNLIPPDCEVDLFACQATIIQDLSIKNMKKLEEKRALKAIERNHVTPYSSVRSIAVSYDVPKLEHLMLPYYVLEYPNRVPSFLAGYGPAEVTGLYELSSLKIALLFSGCAFAGVLSGAMLPMSLGMQMGAPLAAGFMGAISTKLYYNGSTALYQGEISERQRTIESIAEAPKDKQRRLATEAFTLKMSTPSYLSISPEHFQAIGLDSNNKPTPQEIETAINKKMFQTHPDNGGNAGQFIRVMNARKAFKSAITTQKRFFSENHTGIKLKVREPFSSVHSPYARQLIVAVLDRKDYAYARKLVDDEVVHPDAHDDGENTLLTEAAKRGNLQAVEFAVNTLEASLDTSCDCPCHRTALHYAVKNGHEAIVRFLVEKGASVNLITSRGETALDLAKSQRREAIANYLIQNGGIQNTESASRWRIFGYSSKERTLLMGHNSESTLESTNLNQPRK